MADATTLEQVVEKGNELLGAVSGAVSNIYSLAAAQTNGYATIAAGLAATAEGGTFWVWPGGDDGLAYTSGFKVTGGIAVLFAVMADQRAIDALGVLINTPETGNVAVSIEVGGQSALVITRDGALEIIGLTRKVGDSVAANMQRTQQGREVSRFYSGDTDWHVQMPDGRTYFPGVPGALQDLYAIRQGGKIRAAIAQIDALAARDPNPASRYRTYSALDNTGALMTVGVTTRRITNRATPKISAWPQGKMCTDSQGRTYMGFNRASSHGGSDTRSYVTWTDDGEVWAEPVKIAEKSNARGTDCFAIGVDASDNVFAIVRNRGSTNAIGATYYELYKSADRGAAWTLLCTLDSGPTQDGFVPELYHDLCYVPQTGRFVTGFHFAASPRLGFLSFDPSDPLATITTVDVIAADDASLPAGAVTYCEPTINVDTAKDSANNWIYGGIRTQRDATYPSKLYYMQADLSGFTMFDAPEHVRYSPVTVKRVGSFFVASLIERFNAGTINLWIGTPTNFYSGNAAAFTKVPIGRIVRTAISGSTNVGVQAMAVRGTRIVLGFSQEWEDGATDVFALDFDVVRSTALLTYEQLEAL